MHLFSTDKKIYLLKEHNTDRDVELRGILIYQPEKVRQM